VSRYQKGNTNLDFTEARDSEWQWHQLGRMQVCTSLQTDNHTNTSPLSFFTGRMPFLPPNQQRQSTKGITDETTLFKIHYHCNCPCNGSTLTNSLTTWVSWYQKGKTDLDFTEARDNEWQWHQPGHIQVCTSLQTDNHVSTLPLSFLQAGCASCCPTDSVKALKCVYTDIVISVAMNLNK